MSLKRILQLFFLWLHDVRYVRVEEYYVLFVPFESLLQMSFLLSPILANVSPSLPPASSPTPQISLVL